MPSHTRTLGVVARGWGDLVRRTSHHGESRCTEKQSVGDAAAESLLALAVADNSSAQHWPTAGSSAEPARMLQRHLLALRTSPVCNDEFWS